MCTLRSRNGARGWGGKIRLNKKYVRTSLHTNHNRMLTSVPKAYKFNQIRAAFNFNINQPTTYIVNSYKQAYIDDKGTWCIGGLNCSRPAKNAKICEVIKQNTCVPVDLLPYVKYVYSTWFGACVIADCVRPSFECLSHLKYSMELKFDSIFVFTVWDLSVDHFQCYFGENLEDGNSGPLCATQECQVRSMWCLQSVLHNIIYSFTGHCKLGRFDTCCIEFEFQASVVHTKRN